MPCDGQTRQPGDLLSREGAVVDPHVVDRATEVSVVQMAVLPADMEHIGAWRDTGARADVKAQSRVRAVILGHDHHRRPLARAEHTFERLFILVAGFRGICRVRMQPHTRELFGPSAQVHLFVEERTDRLVIELDTDGRNFLFDGNDVLYKQQVIRIGDAKAAHLIVRLVPEVQQLGPRRRAEPQRKLYRLAVLHPPVVLP